MCPSEKDSKMIIQGIEVSCEIKHCNHLPLPLSTRSLHMMSLFHNIKLDGSISFQSDVSLLCSVICCVFFQHTVEEYIMIGLHSCPFCALSELSISSNIIPRTLSSWKFVNILRLVFLHHIATMFSAICNRSDFVFSNLPLIRMTMNFMHSTAILALIYFQIWSSSPLLWAALPMQPRIYCPFPGDLNDFSTVHSI